MHKRASWKRVLWWGVGRGWWCVMWVGGGAGFVARRGVSWENEGI